jgi:hypothetical protein
MKGLERGDGEWPTTRLELQQEELSHVKLASKREEIIETIRTTVPGFKNFLQPLPLTVWFKDLPASGPVVVLNAFESRCDAIVLVPDLEESVHIPLPGFSPQKAEHLREQLRSSLLDNMLLQRGEPERGIRPAGEKAISDVLCSILRELWKGVVKPILDGLAFSVSRSFQTQDSTAF